MKIAKRIAALAALAAPLPALAAWPDKPIHVIVPFTAGSGIDVVARTVLEPVARALKQPVVIENKPGAGGTLGAARVAKSPPDGYTLLVHSAAHAANPAIYGNLPYDTVKDFAGVSPLASLPNVLIVSPRKGYKKAQDLVAAAKAKPGEMSYASDGNGSATHVNAEIFRQSAGFGGRHIPFKSTPEAIAEVAAGRADFFFAPLVSALPPIKEGRLQALAVGTPKRSPILPDVPTTTELGYRNSEYVFWVALLAPAGTPRPVVDRLNAEVVKALASSDTRKKLEEVGAEPMPMKPADFDDFIESEVARIGAVVKAAGVRAN